MQHRCAAADINTVPVCAATNMRIMHERGLFDARTQDAACVPRLMPFMFYVYCKGVVTRVRFMATLYKVFVLFECLLE